MGVKSGGKSGLAGYAMPRAEFGLGLNPAGIFNIWAQCGAQAPQLAEQIKKLPTGPNLHIAVYWSLNDITRQGEPKCSRAAAEGSHFVVVEPDDKINAGIQ